VSASSAQAAGQSAAKALPARATPLSRLRYCCDVARHRLIERPLWTAYQRHGGGEVEDAAFMAKFRWPGKRPAASVEQFVSELLQRTFSRWFFRPADKDALLGSLAEPESFAAEAEDYCTNHVDLLGSGRVWLGDNIDWHRDFKSGFRWPATFAADLDYVDWEDSSDAKVPWEISRFHGLAWLGKAYWATGEERYAHKFRDLIEQWLAANRFGYGINWTCAMEAAFRALNWLLAISLFGDAPSLPSSFWLRMFKSLYAHGLFIRYNLECGRVSGNHYLADGMGLFVLGTVFRDTAAGRGWLRAGRHILESEIRRQTFPDGVNYEKACGYHRLALEMLYVSYLLGGRNGVAFSSGFRDRLEKMFEFVMHYTKPDGQAPLVGDSDNGRLFRFRPGEDFNDHRHVLAVGAVLFSRADFKAHAGGRHEDVLWLTGTRGLSQLAALPDAARPLDSEAFPWGGFYIMRSGDAHTIIDAGELGLEGLGGHGHNDTFSFELYIGGENFITDSGTYVYTSDVAAHQAFASTAAHNTVVVDGREIAEFKRMWCVVEDGTRPKVLRWESNFERDVIEAEHYGYTRLPQPVVHRRSAVFEKQTRRWTIEDHLLGAGEHTCDLYFHLSPQLRVKLETPRRAVITGATCSLGVECSADLRLLEGFVSPSYGVRIAGPVLQASLRAAAPVRFFTSIWPLLPPPRSQFS
jgi:hypothetical protein